MGGAYRAAGLIDDVHDGKKLLDGADAGDITRYVYKGGEVSPDLKVGARILDEDGKLVEEIGGGGRGIKGESKIKFRTGELYEDFIEVNGYKIDAIAEVEIDGDRLKLKEIAIYSNKGDIPNRIGANEFKIWLQFIKEQAKNQGFKELHVIAQRAAYSTSANPGHIIDKIIRIK